MSELEREAIVSADPVDLYWTEDEVRQRLDALTPEACWKLLEVARIYADGTGGTPEDLLQDAFVAAASRRAWRTDLELPVYFTGIFRSLAFARRKARKVNALDQGLKGKEENRARALAEVPNADTDDPARLLEEREDEAQLGSRLMHLFADDPEVLRVIEDRMMGMVAEHTRATLGVDAGQYETICRRLSRGYRTHLKRQNP